MHLYNNWRCFKKSKEQESKNELQLLFSILKNDLKSQLDWVSANPDVKELSYLII